MRPIDDDMQQEIEELRSEVESLRKENSNLIDSVETTLRGLMTMKRILREGRNSPSKMQDVRFAIDQEIGRLVSEYTGDDSYYTG